MCMKRLWVPAGNLENEIDGYTTTVMVILRALFHLEREMGHTTVWEGKGAL